MRDNVIFKFCIVSNGNNTQCTALNRMESAMTSNVPVLQQSLNPADVVLDLLSNVKYQQMLLEHYQSSPIPRQLHLCIDRVQSNARLGILRQDLTMDTEEKLNTSVEHDQE